MKRTLSQVMFSSLEGVCVCGFVCHCMHMCDCVHEHKGLEFTSYSTPLCIAGSFLSWGGDTLFLLTVIFLNYILSYKMTIINIYIYKMCTHIQREYVERERDCVVHPSECVRSACSNVEIRARSQCLPVSYPCLEAGCLTDLRAHPSG